ncbi:MAG: cadmium-translocating P-type ATPase [Oribacterium sp.]|nr:cadmium-translocating P-type ATPase [Oribacterium sp.]MBQ5331572.1 cadmium-translocating P-type ATPase [Oscillospiraceae bacterium]
MNKKQKKSLYRIIIAAVLTAIFHFLPVSGVLRLILFLIPYIIIGYDILKKCFLGIIHGQVFDECFLMTVATAGAFVIAVIDGTGDYTEAVAVMLFYQTGELFESIAVGKSRKNISGLMDIRPDSARLETENGLETVDPDEVEVGSVIVVEPGEKIPIDGVVISGSSSLNTSALTGESLPRDCKEGDEVLSGSINISGEIRIRTSKPFGESTASKIMDLVENSSSRKSRSEKFISKFASVYTPAVCIGALCLAVLPPLVNLAAGSAPLWGTWVYRALIFLVISCPCALVVSIPLSFFAGLGGAGHEGILIKGANYLETLSKVKTVVFDKTGTLTKGTFDVKGIHHGSMDDSKLIEYAAIAECPSSHPISKSIRSAYGKKIDRSRLGITEEIGGKGMISYVDTCKVAVGNDKLMDHIGVGYCSCHSVGTVVHMAIDSEYAGHILISDTPKETSKAAVKELKKQGVEETVMLTGDIDSVGKETARDLGLDKVYTELLPADKVEKTEMLLSNMKKGDTLAFVGDGMNDAPVLSRADVGIAMGALGSDAAIEAADVVIMDDDPMKVAVALKHSKRCMGIVYENIYFAIGIKVLCLILGALGFANMWLAIFADVGVLVICILNAVRALKVR